MLVFEEVFDDCNILVWLMGMEFYYSFWGKRVGGVVFWNF